MGRLIVVLLGVLAAHTGRKASFRSPEAGDWQDLAEPGEGGADDEWVAGREMPSIFCSTHGPTSVSVVVPTMDCHGHANLMLGRCTLSPTR